MKRLLFFFLICGLTFSACRYITGEHIDGNGTIKREARTAGSFSEVDVSGAIDLIVQQDAVSKVEIETDENLLQYIDVRMEGDQLVISARNGYDLDPTSSVKAYVSAPEIKAIEASGACKVRSTNQLSSNSSITISLSGASTGVIDARCPEVKSDISGASQITLRGQTKDARLEASGSSRIEAFDLLAENSVVDISGASHANVFASVKLDAEASGASGVRYRGNAQEVRSDASGASSVKKAD